ncbi:hypothetical protein COF80_00120 [Bacillus toyonensis]|nr:hypothetical protein CN636_06505 [Bacillus toyonensis]PHE90202.1 hypothetical protein COF80_00120 [Bacillus toyonensis]
MAGYGLTISKNKIVRLHAIWKYIPDSLYVKKSGMYFTAFWDMDMVVVIEHKIKTQKFVIAIFLRISSD